MKNERVIRAALILIIAIALIGIVDARPQKSPSVQASDPSAYAVATSQYSTPTQGTSAYGTSDSRSNTLPAVSQAFAVSGDSYSAGYSYGLGDEVHATSGSSIWSPYNVNSLGGAYANGDYASTGGNSYANQGTPYNSAGNYEQADAIGNAFGYAWSVSWG